MHPSEGAAIPMQPPGQDQDQIAMLEKEVTDELMQSHSLKVQTAYEVNHAKLAAYFNERLDAFRRHEERLERRSKVAEKRYNRENEANAQLRLENARLLHEIDAARDFIATFQQAQRQRICKALHGANPEYPHSYEATDFVTPQLPPAGPGLIKAAMSAELVELRARAQSLAVALEEATKQWTKHETDISIGSEIAESAVWRTQLELAVERERKRTGKRRA